MIPVCYLVFISMQTFIYLFVIPIQPLAESEMQQPEILIQIPFQSRTRAFST